MCVYIVGKYEKREYFCKNKYLIHYNFTIARQKIYVFSRMVVTQRFNRYIIVRYIVTMCVNHSTRYFLYAQVNPKL